MGFGEAIQSGFRHYVTFSGRAPRSEFWYWQLFAVIVSIVANVIDTAIGLPLVSVIVSLGLLLPGIAVGVRRLHDIDRTGWWLLLVFTIIGTILLIVWACFEGTAGSNSYGPDPLAGGA
jgi:uncharacterized membrane protein YhaH (DUF805 family)